MNCTVLGAGRVGQAIAFDLARDPEWTVTVADRSADALAALRSGVERRVLDLGESGALERAVADQDLIVGALPSAIGFETLRRVLEAGRPYVDISFFEQDPFALDQLARDNGCTAVVDCGVAPGLDNVLLGRATRVFDRVDRFVCRVGGLPVQRSWPWEYKAPFAPADVLAEYTRPARLMEGGRVVVKPALSDVELIEVPGVGTLEAFNTDGLRTLLTTVDVPSMKEMTLRYPGHADRVRVLRESGFLSPERGGLAVAPLELTSALLFEQWRLEDDDDEFTVLQVELAGLRDGVAEEYRFSLLDRREQATGLSSMARTTGYTCAAVARLVASGRFDRKGVSAPEHVGQSEGCVEQVLGDLAARGVHWHESTAASDLPGPEAARKGNG